MSLTEDHWTLAVTKDEDHGHATSSKYRNTYRHIPKVWKISFLKISALWHRCVLPGCGSRGGSGSGDSGTVDTSTVIFTYPCIVVLHFTSGPCLVGFYHSHDKHKPRKRTKEFRPNFLRNLVIACTTETIPLYPAGREADVFDSREADVLDRCGVIL